MLAINIFRSLTKSSLKSHLFAPLYTSFLVLVLLILGQQGFNMWVEQVNYQESDWRTYSLIVQHEGERLLNAVIDEQAASADYSHQQLMIENDDESSFAFRDSFNKLYDLMQDNPAQLKELDRIKHLHNHWLFKLNQNMLSNYVSSYHITEGGLFSYLRNQINILIEREEKILGERRNNLEKLNQIKTIINIFSTVTIIAGAAIHLQRLHRRAEVPLHQLTETGKLWRQGQMEVQLDYSSRDEIGQLAVVLDGMADETRHRQERIEVRNQQLEDMICALSHDLRTPLLATRSTLDGMIKGAFGTVSETWKEIFEEYRQANEDILKLVEVLLDVSRYESGRGVYLNYDPLDWEKIFIKVITTIKASSKCELNFTIKIPQSQPTVYGDELEIQRVVQNLVDNAVRVSKPLSEISLGTTICGGQVRVYVCDKGSGIAPQEKERLFHRFIQGKGRHGKAGLGLYLCRQIIESHSGTIGVESSPGEGSTFWFTLPLNKSKAREI